MKKLQHTATASTQTNKTRAVGTCDFGRGIRLKLSAAAKWRQRCEARENGQMVNWGRKHQHHKETGKRCFDFTMKRRNLWSSCSLRPLLSRIPLADFHDTTQGYVGRMWNCQCQWWISSSVKVPVTELAGTIFFNLTVDLGKVTDSGDQSISHISHLAAMLQIVGTWSVMNLPLILGSVAWNWEVNDFIASNIHRASLRILVTNIHWCSSLFIFSVNAFQLNPWIMWERGTRRSAPQGIFRHKSGPSHRYPHISHRHMLATNTCRATNSQLEPVPPIPCLSLP